MFKKTIIALAMIGAATMVQAQASTEGFEDVTALASKGFKLINDSTPGGTTFAGQGGGSFGAQAGTPNSYLTFNYNNAPAGGTISSYLITPIFSTNNFFDISFSVRGEADPSYFDQLSYGLSEGGFELGDFALNNVFTVSTDEWTKYTLHFAGTGAITNGRFAIRYSGLADQSNLVGIDSLSVDLPEPATTLMLGAGLVGLMVARRRKQA